jgi:hypothetical protein
MRPVVASVVGASKRCRRIGVYFGLPFVVHASSKTNGLACGTSC